MTDPGWRWDRVRGDAGALHDRSAARLQGVEVTRSVWWLDPPRPAVVLGSIEPAEHVDAQAARATGIDVARRRSGGGAVLVGPGRCLWIDLVIGRGDPLWHDDIGRAARWVAELWIGALAAVGVAGAVAWEGRLERSRWSDRACFGGLGPGEVTVQGNKVVGVSQRRTRSGALFQCAALLGPASPAAGPHAVDGLAELVAVQSLAADERALMLDELRRRTFPLPLGVEPGLIAALRSLLDTP